MITGRVTARGAPVAGARVHAHWIDPRQPFHRFAHRVHTRLQAAVRNDVTTGDDGRFRLPVQRDGRYVLHAEADGLARGESIEFDVANGIAGAGIDVALQQPAAIEGRVLVPTGDDVRGQIVAATRGDGHVDVAVTDADGAFRFAGLSPGAWQVRACRHDDLEWLRMARTWPERGIDELPIDVELVPGETARFDVDLRERKGAVVTGRLLFDGAPRAGARVSLWNDGEYVFAETDADGRFEQRCTPGASTAYFFVKLPAGGQLRLERPVAFAAGANTVDVDVATGGIELVGLPPSAAPLREGRSDGYALIWNTRGGVACQYHFDPDQDGRHRVEALPVGTARLHRREAEQYLAENGTVISDVEIVRGQLRVVAPK
jgi:hypothetical protein